MKSLLKKAFLPFIGGMLLTSAALAQKTDYTEYLVNPSFETNDASGWTQIQNFGGWFHTDKVTSTNGMGAYTGVIWGDRMGDNDINQTVYGLKPGVYEASCYMYPNNIAGRKITTQSFYAQNKILFYGKASDYSTDLINNYTTSAQQSLFAGYSFPTSDPASGDAFQKMILVVTVGNDSTLTLGVKTAGLKSVYIADIDTTHTSDDWGFRTTGSMLFDNFKLQRIENANSVADLRALSVSDGTLTPSFDPNVTEYSVEVPVKTATVTVDAASYIDAATVTGAGDIDVPAAGATSTIKVKAVDGTEKTYTIHFTKPNDVTFYYVNSAPVIDGVISATEPWADVQWKQQLAVRGIAKNGTASQFQMTHDDDNIYVAVKVDDNTPNTQGSISALHERDCVEFFFSMDPTVTAYASGSGVWQIRIQRDGKKLSGSAAVDSLTMIANGFEYKTNSTADGYVVEAKFPISMLQQDAYLDMPNMKFEIQTGDNTTGASGGRTYQMFWKNNSDLQWSSPNYFTDVQLSDKVVANAVNTTNAKAATVIVNREAKSLRFVNAEGVVNVYNVNGILVRTITVNELNQSVSVSDLASGVYIVKGEKLVAKIIL